MKKIMYLHGLEGDANGTKGLYCQTQYGAVSPQMPATLKALLQNKSLCISDCYEVALKAVLEHKPDIIIGSSFGGGITMLLMQRGHHKGDAILLAPAGVKYGLSPQLPQESKVILIHDPEDDIVPYSDSLKILSANAHCQLWKADSGHKLHDITTNGQLNRAVYALSQV